MPGIRQLLNLNLVAAIMVVASMVSPVEAGKRSNRQTFSIRVPGRVELAATSHRPDGSLEAIRVKSTERVDLIVERRSFDSDPLVPVIRSSLTNPDASFSLHRDLIPHDAIEGARTTVVITVVPH